MRRVLVASVASTFLGIVSPANAQWAGHQAVRSSSFQASVGVNIGIDDEWDTAYSDNANGGAGYNSGNAGYGPVLINGRTLTNVSKMVQAFWYTGIGHARVSFGGTYAVDRIQAIAQAVPWLRLDVEVSNGHSIGDQLGWIGGIAYMVEAIEGLNEAAENASYEGQYGVGADCQFQAELFGQANSWKSQHGSGATILAPTVSGQNWNDFAALSQCAWAANAMNGHLYSDNTGPTQQLFYDLPYLQKDQPYNGAPLWATEAGYSTNAAAPRGLNEDVAAKRTLSALLGFSANGVSRTYLYELVDENPQSPRLNDNYNWDEMEMHYGLYNNDWSPKETARMLHSQLQIVQDLGSNAYGFSPGYMSYNIQNQPPATYSYLMQKSDGSWLLALWAEPPGMYVSATNNSWGYETNTPTSYPTITFDRSFSLIQTADPFAAGWDTPSYNWAGANTNSVTVPLSDHVIYIVLKP